MTDALRERVARAIYETPPKEYPGWVGLPPELEPWEKVPDFIQRAFHDYADAAIALIRAETLEEAAKVCDKIVEKAWERDHERADFGMASAIRALAKP